MPCSALFSVAGGNNGTNGIIGWMRRDSLVFLIIGFTIGFLAFYLWTKQREPQIVSAMPTRLLLPSNASNGAPPDTQAQAPAVDPAEVKKLQDRVKADPRDFEALVSLGNVDFDQRNYADAAGYYTKALAIHDDLDVRTDLGTMLFYSNHYDEAMTELKKVLAVNPNHAQALFNLGVVFLHGKKDPENALQIWQKLVDTNPDFPEIGVVKQQIQALKDSQKK
jgi:cytochrome c-type biogenesis protein CcmH/NrfG